MSFRENIERHCCEMEHECSNCILEPCCTPVSQDLFPDEMTQGQLDAVEFKAKMLVRDLTKILSE